MVNHENLPEPVGERKGRKDMRIVVLAGGISTERDVSLCSGKMIYNAIKGRHDAILLDVYLGYEGEVDESLFTEDRDWSANINPVSEQNPDIEKIKALRRDPENGFFGPNVIRICQMADLVFIGLHGENGENGKVQAAFDLLGIRYTGTDYVSSALSMDKALTKELFLQNKVPTADSVTLKRETDWKNQIPCPCVVKTCCGGSSVGVYIANQEAEAEVCIREAFRYGSDVMVEQYIKGREFSIGVIDGKALPIIEIAPKQGFYDYKNKHQAGSTVEPCPAELPADVAAGMQAAAELAFRVLRLKVYARMDFMMNDRYEFYCLEANTLPGFTPTSLLPQEAAAIGMSFEDLCERIIDLSVEKE